MFTEKINNQLIYIDTFSKLNSVMEQYKDKKIRVAYSGGSDSDTVMFILKEMGYNISSVFYDTGLEYNATWKHLDYMRLLGYNIEVIKAKTSIPTSNKKYGNPFISKRVSDMLQRLQSHNFDFQNDGLKSFEELTFKYPNTRSALRWWTNTHDGIRTNISWNRNLKEFLIEYGLPFKVANKCCDGAKKLPIKSYIKENNIDLMIMGIRKAEGGTRATAYKNCFIQNSNDNYAMYFPLFWWKQEDKKIFDEEMNIKHSDCYSTYGLKRTGCAGCPFGQEFEFELNAISKFEPKLEKGINNIFAKSYDWTRKYNEFKKVHKK